jgi:tetratricopeptide (TPR) repeat protein
MRRAPAAVLLAPTLLLACAGGGDRRTLAELRTMEPDVSEVQVEGSLEQAMLGYRKFLEEAPESALTPEAMRRLADLKLEKEYGLLGDGELVEMPAPEPTAAAPGARDASGTRPRAAGVADHSESEADFERRAAAADELARPAEGPALQLPGGKDAGSAGPLEAIALYDQILETYPDYTQNDQVLYQKARAYDELGRVDEAVVVIEQLIATYPHSRHIDEAQFRRAEYFFTRRKYRDAEEAYSAITKMGPHSEYYELALYKLGWTFYKQDLHEEALDQYVALLDFKVSTGYDFDQTHDEDSERRIADTYRVISLSFSNIGGPEAVSDYFSAKGHRSYEDRIYSHLGEFYFEKLRYDDAAKAYKAFVALNPLHRAAPHFSMRVVEIFEAGGFPKLVLEAKKEFAATYALDSEYWRHFDVDEAPDVLSYLKSNLVDLANHHHALYQNGELEEDKPANFAEATRWYRAYLGSFPADPGSPGVNHRLADLLLENRDFGAAAREYERTAYDYAAHEGAAKAGYAAIYAHRENQKAAAGDAQEAAKREAVTSTLRFVEAFPAHDRAATVLGAAVEDLYGMKEFGRAIVTGRKLLDGYPQADPAIRRSAWTVVAHSSFELADYAQAEHAYAQVLATTPADDASRAKIADNLAAAIYKQGEKANTAGDHRAAADHFLRIGQAAPSSTIAPAAEYDAAAALIRLEDWAGAATVLESFREAHPDHALYREATKQIAFVYREQGELSRSASEYVRVAAEAEDPELRREALLVAGGLYEDAKVMDRALAVHLDYVRQFPKPVEMAVETRFKIAGMYEAAHDQARRHEQLRKIVEIDEAAGGERTDRVRYLAARSALVLAEGLYAEFDAVALTQPFEKNLQEKQRRMEAALGAYGKLVDYEVGEVTAAATFYMAEIYGDFSRSLVESERPADLGPSELEDYEMALEEEAFPFEEKAIEVHEKNLELMSAGVYNAWIEKSLARLAALMPGRYAKSEASSGFIAAIDTYAYQPPPLPGVPAVTEVAPPAGAADAAQAAEVAPAAQDAAVQPPAAPEAPPPAAAAEAAPTLEAAPAALDTTVQPAATTEVAPPAAAAEAPDTETAPAAPETTPGAEAVEVAPPAAAADATAPEASEPAPTPAEPAAGDEMDSPAEAAADAGATEGNHASPR